MAKRQFALTDTEEQELREAYAACTDGAQRTRLQAVRLYGSGWAVDVIVEISGCTWRSLSRWCHAYRHAGLVSLADQRSGGNRALLSTEQRTEIQRKLQQYTPDAIFSPEHQSGGAGAYWSVPDLRRAVARWTGWCTKLRSPTGTCSKTVTSVTNARNGNIVRARRRMWPPSANRSKKNDGCGPKCAGDHCARRR